MEFLQPAMWHDHDIDFVMWPHPAMWHVALESWQWIHQVAAPYSVIGGSGMTCHWIRSNVRHVGILHLVSISITSRSRHVILHQSPTFYPNRTTVSRKKWRHVNFQDGGSRPSWILGINNGLFEKLNYITSYRSSIDTKALNCLVFQKIAFLHFGVNIQDGGSPPSWILGVL